MVYRILADIAVLTHFLWILFLFLGAIWGRRHKTIKILHLSGLAFALIIQLFHGYCPLTYLEVWLRSRYAPETTWAGSFIIHYAEKIVYLELSRTLVFVFTLLICCFNGWLYLRRHR
jgi:hypothetical protein